MVMPPPADGEGYRDRPASSEPAARNMAASLTGHEMLAAYSPRGWQVTRWPPEWADGGFAVVVWIWHVAAVHDPGARRAVEDRESAEDESAEDEAEHAQGERGGCPDADHGGHGGSSFRSG